MKIKFNYVNETEKEKCDATIKIDRKSANEFFKRLATIIKALLK